MIMETSAPNILSAKIGDQVEIETETTNILKASFIIYTFPLILFIIGTFLGYLISSYTLFKDWSNTVGFIFGVLFMAFSYFIIKKREGNLSKDQAFKPDVYKRQELWCMSCGKREYDHGNFSS